MKRLAEVLISSIGIAVIATCLTSPPIVRASTAVSQGDVARPSIAETSQGIDATISSEYTDVNLKDWESLTAPNAKQLSQENLAARKR